LGRVDDQIKIRGMRVEPGEIEAALRRHEAVREAVVVVREETPGNKSLVAYVVCKSDSPAEAELKTFLRKSLLEHMVPAFFVFVETLPTTPSGKVDKRTLREAYSFRPAPSLKPTIPRDHLELKLATIWKSVMGLESIGVTDNFFDLGGHSLLAAQLFDAITKRLGVKLPLATLFKASTIEQLARLIRDETKKDIWASLVPIKTEGTRLPLFLIHAAGGNVLFCRDLARYLGDDQPLYALQSPGLNGESPVDNTVEDIAKRYLEEIRCVQPEGPFLLGGRCFGAFVALEIAQMLRSQGQEVAQLVVFDSAPPRSMGRLPRVQGKSIAYYVRKSWDRLLSGDFHRVFSNWIVERKFARRLNDRLRLREEWKVAGVRRNRGLERSYAVAARKYVASPYDGSVTLIRSAEFSALERKNGHLGWGELARGGFEHFVVPSQHLDMFREPSVKAVAKLLTDCLDAANAHGGLSKSVRTRKC
jgi:thioesterase domain-containing protein/acyl carrier protein